MLTVFIDFLQWYWKLEECTMEVEFQNAYCTGVVWLPQEFRRNVNRELQREVGVVRE